MALPTTTVLTRAPLWLGVVSLGWAAELGVSKDAAPPGVTEGTLSGRVLAEGAAAALEELFLMMMAKLQEVTWQQASFLENGLRAGTVSVVKGVMWASPELKARAPGAVPQSSPCE